MKEKKNKPIKKSNKEEINGFYVGEGEDFLDQVSFFNAIAKRIDDEEYYDALILLLEKEENRLEKQIDRAEKYILKAQNELEKLNNKKNIVEEAAREK